jgi:hypothetical protein
MRTIGRTDRFLLGAARMAKNVAGRVPKFLRLCDLSLNLNSPEVVPSRCWVAILSQGHCLELQDSFN